MLKTNFLILLPADYQKSDIQKSNTRYHSSPLQCGKDNQLYRNR